jgi:hypothetical protein
MPCEWDVQGVRQLAKSDRRFSQFFADLASRDRSPSITKLDALDRYEIGADAARRFFRELESCLCGKFILGRRNHPTRFVWSYRAVDIAGSAVEGLASPHPPERPSENQTSAVVHIDEPLDDEPESAWRDYSFPLRDDSDVTISLPADLQADEAYRLAVFILTLPTRSNITQQIEALRPQACLSDVIDLLPLQSHDTHQDLRSPHDPVFSDDVIPGQELDLELLW